MLTPDQIEALRIKAGQITDPVVEFLIADIASRISEAGQMTSTAAYQVWRAQQLGLSQRQLKKELRKRLKVSHRELRKLMTQAAEVGYDYDISRFPYVQAVPFAENDSLQKIVNAAIEQADEGLTNLTQTMGFVTHDGVVTELTEAYQKSCDFAFEKVITGAQDYQSAIREATKGLADKGILTLDYDSGVHRSLEAAVRANTMGGLSNMSREIKQHNHDDLGCDGWEISAHEFSAPDHEPFQGRQYSDEEYARLQAMLVRDFETLGCHHDVTGIILGVNEPQYTEEQLEEMRRRNEEGFIIDGKHYTGYQATQRQRGLERSIRKKKRQILIDEKLGDTEQLPIDQTRYVVLRDEYARFSKVTGLRTQQERMNVPGFGPKQDRAAENTVQSTEEDVFRNKNMDLHQMSAKVDEELNKHCGRSSKWSGKTVVKPRDAMVGVAGRKDWNCDITLREDAGVKTVVHEHLHARSVSYYDRETYLIFQRAEEGAVELFAQEICLKNKASFRQAYTEPVKRLRIINSITKTADGYDFAKQLFDIPLPERYNWLRGIADTAIATGNLSDKSIQVLNDAVAYMRGKGGK